MLTGTVPIYCQTHQAHFAPEPSGYYSTQAWVCPEGDRVTRNDMARYGLAPEHLSGIVVSINRRGGETLGTMIGFPHGAHVR